MMIWNIYDNIYNMIYGMIWYDILYYDIQGLAFEPAIGRQKS